MQFGYIAIFLFSILATASTMGFYPININSDEFGQDVVKRAFYNRKPFKREFNVDDLTLRFGKRSGESMAFSPDQLSLRFGR